MYQLESYSALLITVLPQLIAPPERRVPVILIVIRNRMNIINPNSTHFKAVVDSQGMQYLRDYVLLDRLQPFGIVDPNENA